LKHAPLALRHLNLDCDCLHWDGSLPNGGRSSGDDSSYDSFDEWWFSDW
jgi:hypothetical protein